MTAQTKTQTANLDPARLGVYGTGNDRHTILYKRHLAHPIEKVWQAITEPEHRAAWFPELTLEHAVGGSAIVNFSGSECPPPEDNPEDINYCKVTVFEPPSVLEYRGPTEHHRFELTPEGSGCLLTFLATLPADGIYDDDGQTIESRFSVACGWHYKLDEMEWSLDGIEFEDEGYAGPIKTELYFAYRKMSRES